MKRWTCCGSGRVVCMADNLSHALRLHWRWLCNEHDARITGERP